MCEDCGCSLTGGHTAASHHTHGHALADDRRTVEVLKGILSRNDERARHNREHLDRHGVLGINLMSSPGAGKTSLLEATIDALAGRYRIGVIEGDLETENDATRIRARGVPAVQITTGSACHLDSTLVHEALHELALDELDVVFIENVGNLVCPAAFRLGQHADVVLLSTPEGDDKPEKYPVMFRAADLTLITKSDLTEALGDFDAERARASLQRIGVDTPLIELSARRSDSLGAWLQWLEQRLAQRLAEDSAEGSAEDQAEDQAEEQTEGEAPSDHAVRPRADVAS